MEVTSTNGDEPGIGFGRCVAESDKALDFVRRKYGFGRRKKD